MKIGHYSRVVFLTQRATPGWRQVCPLRGALIPVRRKRSVVDSKGCPRPSQPVGWPGGWHQSSTRQSVLRVPSNPNNRSPDPFTLQLRKTFDTKQVHSSDGRFKIKLPERGQTF